MSAAAAWGVLWELSGLEVTWLSPSTLWRVRRRLRVQSADDIARATSGRTRVHRYRAANAAIAGAGLVATGRAAGSSLKVGLMNDTRRVCGYLPQGMDAAAYAAMHFMVADPAGQDVLYENSVPVPINGPVMPVAVIAADLAVSSTTRERSGGLSALDALRRQWLAKSEE